MPNEVDRTPVERGRPIKGNLEYFGGPLLDIIRDGFSGGGFFSGLPSSRIAWFLFGTVVHVPATIYNTYFGDIPFDAGAFIFKAIVFGFFFAAMPRTGCFILLLAAAYAGWVLIYRPW